jgi:hypothetical protein
MAQEFTIKSPQIEDKINQLLPSQGGAGAGVDFSASTMVVPIVNLTETAEGSALRQDLQTAFSYNTTNVYSVSNTTSTVLTTTGYYRFYGTYNSRSDSSGDNTGSIKLNDGTTDKNIWVGRTSDMTTITAMPPVIYDFIVKLEAGHSVKITTNDTDTRINGIFRQLADINGNLINP